MPRFFVESDAVSDGVARISGADARHIARALRMAVGEEITVCTSDGVEHACRLSHIRDEEVLAEVLSDRQGVNESPVRIRLYMAYPKGDKLELVVQKATELGAASVTPYLSERCVRRPKTEKIAGETERLSRIAAEAAKQSGRSALPRVLAPLSFSEMLREAAASELALFCYEGDGTTQLPVILAEYPEVREIAVIVGPEGGFSDGEAAAAREAGARLCGLGRRILRCETAPLFALAGISVLLELPQL